MYSSYSNLLCTRELILWMMKKQISINRCLVVSPIHTCIAARRLSLLFLLASHEYIPCRVNFVLACQLEIFLCLLLSYLQSTKNISLFFFLLSVSDLRKSRVVGSVIFVRRNIFIIKLTRVSIITPHCTVYSVNTMRLYKVVRLLVILSLFLFGKPNKQQILLCRV